MKNPKCRVVKIESRGVDITPAERIARWDETRGRYFRKSIAPPPPPPPLKIAVEWVFIALIVGLIFTSIVLIWVLVNEL